MKQIIELKNVSFRYDKTVEEYQIDTVSFHVKQGEWLSIVGHNGSGKSTVVRLIDGLLEAESGEIYIDGKKLTRETIWEIRSKIGIVFQNPDNQFVGATVEDDVAFGLENQGIPRGEMLQRVEKAIDQVGMLKFKDREPSRLSGGQKQRVAIAGIIALRPTIIILDEATSMLDPEGREDLMAVMRELQKKFQLTIISITHDLSEIALSDRTLVFQKGKLESSMTPRELFSRNDLNDIGLDKPFSKQVQESLSSHFPLKQDYLTESELLDQLWEFL
ncbi:cobalt transporter ATP-binding subunit [Streptococcus parasanguinis]|uniref:ABC transporter ATP-binding protein n=1 Tax=Streptococcus parasanguinis FW213 TaxID=1114965 RepID=I1ZPQ2_STRPA|nr:energy-coupling factor transporter ATPase [Streptococcus parasanguinis]AFJ27026.1 ABC transporter ATP-binding protein [Streptococcus parasanguinis FW213]KJU97622.1 cobalt transporter ATP-binding subunit [Streptococcus parasanguinis]